MTQQSKPSGRPFRIVIAVAATAVVIAGATSVLALSSDSQEEAVQAVVDSVFKGECKTPAAAASELGKQLEAGGYADWTIASRAESTDCVTGGVIALSKTVALVPVDAPDVTAAMDEVGAELMRRCLNEVDAKAFVEQALNSVGVSRFEIQTDGPLAYPTDQEKDVLKHLDAGCFVYSGAGHTRDGIPVYFINGK